MNPINMKNKIIVWKFAVPHFQHMHVAMVTVTFIWTSESIYDVFIVGAQVMNV